MKQHDTGLKPEHAKAVTGFMRGMNKQEALLYAGYSESYARTRAKDVFGRDDVKDEIARRHRSALRRAEVDEAWIVKQLKAIVEADPGELLSLSTQAAETKQAQLAKLSQGLKMAADIEYTERGIKFRITAAVRIQALKLLGDYIAMWKQKVELGGDEEVIALIESGRARATRRREALTKEGAEQLNGGHAGHA